MVHRCPRCHGDDSRRLGLDLARGQKSPKAASFHQIKRCAGHGRRAKASAFPGTEGPRCTAHFAAAYTHRPFLAHINACKTARPHTSYNRSPLICLLCVYTVIALRSVAERRVTPAISLSREQPLSPLSLHRTPERVARRGRKNLKRTLARCSSGAVDRTYRTAKIRRDLV